MAAGDKEDNNTRFDRSGSTKKTPKNDAEEERMSSKTPTDDGVENCTSTKPVENG